MGNCFDDFDTRHALNHNLAENLGKEHFEAAGFRVYRFGFDKQFSAQDWGNLPAVIKNMPDWVAINGRWPFYLVECKGCGNNLRVKVLDLAHYHYWHNLKGAEVVVFAHSPVLGRSFLIGLDNLERSLQHSTVGFYPGDGRAYYEIPLDVLAPFEVKIEKKAYLHEYV
jgi:hypothetical protein